jgi:hypothetical protein
MLPGPANGQVQIVPNPIQPNQTVQGAFQQPLNSRLYNYNPTATPEANPNSLSNPPRGNFILPSRLYPSNLPVRPGAVQPGTAQPGTSR